MENDPKEIMEKAVMHVLEAMAFMFVETVTQDELSDIEDTCLHVQMEFTGETSGDLGLVFPPELAASMAENVLGIEPDGSILEDTLKDAAEEILNVVCGQFLTLMFGDKPIFELSVPHVSRLDSRACNELLKSPGVVAFMVEDSFMLGYVKLG
ncbi:MAG: chemotaxis protein CheX [Deltaproteobacteria bacterium]|nr:chemotaxis protein CheX [Deltaproteobacteria bacterium]